MPLDPDKILDLDKIARLVCEAEVPAFVDHTGGGCATIFAGMPTDDEYGDPRYPVAVGPGWFEQGGFGNGCGAIFLKADEDPPPISEFQAFSNARAYAFELYVGPDKDDYLTEGYTCTPDDDERSVADEIVRQVMQRRGSTPDDRYRNRDTQVPAQLER